MINQSNIVRGKEYRVDRNDAMRPLNFESDRRMRRHFVASQ